MSRRATKDCTFPNCPNKAAGPTRNKGAIGLCSNHGGGYRCQYKNNDGTDCGLGARGSTDFCIKHGGGHRCQYKNNDGTDCGLSAIGTTGFCIGHGGGHRCPMCIDWPDSQGAKKKFEGYCGRCYYRLHPEQKVRNYKTKESAVFCHVKQCFAELPMVDDRIIDGGCSKRRPDIFIELLTHVLMVEVDEDAHVSYDQRCQNRRMMQLSEDIAHRPLVFIRFNPDGNASGPSCWSINSKKLAVVKKKRAQEWQQRLDALCKTIFFWVKTIPEKTVELIKLFY